MSDIDWNSDNPLKWTESEQKEMEAEYWRLQGLMRDLYADAARRYVKSLNGGFNKPEEEDRCVMRVQRD